MRCDWCHGQTFVDGYPCTHCFAGEVNCCEGEVCQPELDEPEQLDLIDLIEALSGEQSI